MSIVFALACAKAEKILNTALSYDPGSKNIFADIAGKSLRVTCPLPPADVIISCTASEIFIQPAMDEASISDAQLSGSAPALILLADLTNNCGNEDSDTEGSDTISSDTKDCETKVYEGPVEISGDNTFVMALRERLQNLDVDWESWLATLLGDIPAHLLAKSACHVRQWQRQTGERAADSVENYFRNEWSSAPWQNSANQFAETLVSLGSDREQVKQRLDSLKSEFLRFIS
jgi:ubiquinone biosynthesis protein UbiJ